jgi:hypothetical protein
VGLQTHLVNEQPLKTQTWNEKLHSTQISFLLFDNLPHSKLSDLLKTLLRTALAIPHKWHAPRQVLHKRRTSRRKKNKGNKKGKSHSKQSALGTRVLHS